MHADSYGLTSEDDGGPRSRPSEHAGAPGGCGRSALARCRRWPRVSLPVRTRCPALSTPWFPVMCQLVPGQDAAGRARDWPLAARLSSRAIWPGRYGGSRSVDVLAWVAAMSRASVLSGYVQAAAELGLDHGGDAESVAARFLAWLAGTSRPWLVVLDDLRDAADLDGLCRQGRRAGC